MVSRHMPDPVPLRQLLRKTEPLSMDFFERPAVDVARDLLSCVLLHYDVAGMIVETEAYLGLKDLAAHASHGVTQRTRVLFGPPGRAYVYFIYGMHECLNVVADREGEGGCVLLRALQPLCGLDVMYERRHWRGAIPGLTNGPGKLTQALSVTRENYGQRITRGPLRIRRWRAKPEFEIGVTPRIGITQCVDWPLRFIWSGNPYLSKK